jgi:lysophospholipase L1-like esterase
MCRRSEFRRRVGAPTLLALACAAVLAACRPATRPTLPAPAMPDARIVFVGDSLVHSSARDHHLLDRIHEELVRLHPERTFDIVEAGVNGDRIADIRARLDRDVLDLRPHAVVLYWDSDVSDVDERSMTRDEVRQIRAAYDDNVRAVIGRLVASGAYVIMSGPTLIGERPRRKNEKDAQLDAYRRINMRIASTLKIEYVDTRRPFFARRPAGTPPDVDHGLLTEDGEHLNDDGVDVAQLLFVRAIDAWLRKPPDVVLR